MKHGGMYTSAYSVNSPFYEYWARLGASLFNWHIIRNKQQLYPVDVGTHSEAPLLSRHHLINNMIEATCKSLMKRT